MSQIRVVLCPIDFSDLSKQEIGLAVEVCEAFGSQLVLHHNRPGTAPGFGKAWEWHEVHHGHAADGDHAEERMRALVAELPATIDKQAGLSSGPLATVLLELAQQLPADLLVIGSHGWSTEEHRSVTERIIDRCNCPVLTIQEGATVSGRFRLRAPDGGSKVPVVVATDLTPETRRVTDYAFDLARIAPLELHLLSVVASDGGFMETDAAQQRLRELVPPDLEGAVQCHVQRGDPIAEILHFSQRVDPAFLVMGEHARGFFRRFFTKDVAREILHRACCPVWFIPGRA